jgi:hypothetical protein
MFVQVYFGMNYENTCSDLLHAYNIETQPYCLVCLPSLKLKLPDLKLL